MSAREKSSGASMLERISPAWRANSLTPWDSSSVDTRLLRREFEPAELFNRNADLL